LLSHSAIVARELQIPCIVSISEVTNQLQTGDLVQMDGATGTVEVLERNKSHEKNEKIN
jgi:pyruvate,water dikinase